MGDPATLLESHDGHWVTLPVLEWRLLFGIFGFDYFPYLVVVVASHVGIVACVRLLMLRAGVVPAIATLLSLALLVFGTGHDNVILPFQTTLNGAVLFGLPVDPATEDLARGNFLVRNLVGIHPRSKALITG